MVQGKLKAEGNLAQRRKHSGANKIMVIAGAVGAPHIPSAFPPVSQRLLIEDALVSSGRAFP